MYIRDLLDHSRVRTTEIYAHADIQMKPMAFEKVVPENVYRFV